MTDIIDRLRELADVFEAQQAPGNLVLHLRAGADEIERKKAEIASLLNTLADARTESMKLRAALREVMDDLTLIGKNNWLPVGLLDDVIYVNARAALEGRT